MAASLPDKGKRFYGIFSGNLKSDIELNGAREPMSQETKGALIPRSLGAIHEESTNSLEASGSPRIESMGRPGR